MTDHQEHIQHLRRAATQNQWDLCRTNVQHLLPYLDQNDALRILLGLARRFLADLANNISEDTEISHFLELLTDISSYEAFGRQGQVIAQALESRYNLPGINNYRSALRRLMQIQTSDHLSDTYLDIWISILSGITMAILFQNWGHQNPELWKKWFRQESRDDAFILARYFRQDPKTQALSSSLWNKLADDIEAALSSKQSPK